MPRELAACRLWWEGPEFLKGPSNWPITFKDSSLISLPELKQVKYCKLSVSSFDILQRYSNINKLIRVVAYCKRFILNCRSSKQSRITDILNVTEINESLKTLFKIAQAQSLSDKLNVLTTLKELKPKHRLLSLAPFIDTYGIMRVGGRLKHSFVKFDMKHSILLDGKHVLSKLIFEDEHLKLLHAGPQLLLATVRRKFWVTSGMNVAKSVVKKCIKCFCFNPKPMSSRMADLLQARVNIASPFSIVGFDYARPFTLKDRKGRGNKTYEGYICLFICFVTKAIHGRT